MADCVRNTSCRVCDSDDLVQILDLGTTPPANAYLRREQLGEPEQRFPLALHFCRSCSLVQSLDVVNPNILFKNYHYMTGASQPSVDHFKSYAERAVAPFVRAPSDLVIDIGGNDGVLLSFLKDSARVLNVDPADNLAPLSEAKGVPFHTAFFTSTVAAELLQQHGHARVVTANNVFAHTDPIRDVFSGVATLIGEDGVFIFEVHWVKHLLQEGCFDQVYHEHLCFYSLHALMRLTEATGMTVFDVEVVPTQGQSLRVFASVGKRERHARVQRLLDEEVQAGLTREETYRTFAHTVAEGKRNLMQLLRELKAAGKRIVGYGAPAKGNTLLNYYGLGTDLIDYIADSTPLKQGLYTPGMHIPIVPPEQLRNDTPDYVLVLAWNFADAILANEQPLRDRGVKFILAMPRVMIV